jgi:hypothetical protein
MQNDICIILQAFNKAGLMTTAKMNLYINNYNCTFMDPNILLFHNISTSLTCSNMNGIIALANLKRNHEWTIQRYGQHLAQDRERGQKSKEKTDNHPSNLSFNPYDTTVHPLHVPT